MNRSFTGSEFSSIIDPLSVWARQTPDAWAIASPNETPLTYAGLETQLISATNALRRLGLVSSDTVAVVVPNGPEAAVAILATATVARCAPLNPELRARELESYLDNLNATAIIFDARTGEEARDFAQERGIKAIGIKSDPGTAAGVFNFISGDSSAKTGEEYSPNKVNLSNHIALLLPTSGTTALPKIVPLSHHNISASALRVAQSLNLDSGDCCLNVMPLFHVHGFVGNLLSSMHVGASVVCCRDFQAPLVLDWLRDFSVTWYSAVPTIHQAIVNFARRQPEKIEGVTLRFIRSASAALPYAVLQDLEEIFSAPVVEAYGMTEAAHQITANPLPPGERKAGSVGICDGVEVSIFNKENQKLSAMQRGEVRIKGDNVITGYLEDEEINKVCFSRGWLCTGDEGYFDQDGYLFLTGRLKEMINRGGEKISPYEIENVLLQHPAVEQAVAFAVPDDYVGEEVGAAVVADPNRSLTAEELQEFASHDLADFKIPRHITFLEDIPVGATGKVQRVGLADNLEKKSNHRKRKNREVNIMGGSAIAETIHDIWSEVLAIETIDFDANFFALGGDSVLATMATSRIQKALNVELNVISLFNAPTIRTLADYVDGRSPEKPPEPIRSGNNKAHFKALKVPDVKEIDVLKGKAFESRDLLDKKVSATSYSKDSIVGHELVAIVLKSLGITHVFGLTGTPINETFAECAKAGIRVIAVHNQSAGAQMAAAQNYAAGRLVAATMMTPGPGMANAAMGALVAKDNGWPLLLIGGGRRQDQRGEGVFQDMDSVTLFRSVTKESKIVDSIQRVPSILERAVTISMNGKPGPVYLDIPEDVLTHDLDRGHIYDSNLRGVSTPGIDSESLVAAANMLQRAERPVLFLDMEVRWGMEDFSLLREFVEANNCPFITTHMTRGYLSDEHRLCCNRVTSAVCGQADLVLILGGRLDWQFRFGSEISAEAKLIQICSEPGDIGIGRTPTLAIVGSSMQAIRMLNLMLSGESRGQVDRLEWLGEIQRIRLKAEENLARQTARDDKPMIPERLMEEIRACIPEQAIVIADGNACYGAVQRVIPALHPLSRYAPGPDGCIGVGIPYAIGVKLARPDQTVVVITGDTAFGLCAMEIETAVRHKVNIIIVVANNDSPSAGKAYALYPKDVADESAMYQPNLAYHLLATSLGAKGEYVTLPEQVKPAMEKALNTKDVTCIHVKVAQFTPVKLRL